MTVKVCLGGTFNIIHQGHLALLSRACMEGDEIFIGLTSDSMAGISRKVKVNSYATRLRNLAEIIEKICPDGEVTIREINDDMGPAATGDFDVIIVSSETVKGAERINRARAVVDLKPLRIVVIEMVLGPDGEKVSATHMIQDRGRNA
ncbi:MAG: pantetheine-phosphate adenylyltransferase [Candidatus Thermoplasmatota archaeon]|nr:pantetheine-phosphate adenylyltransferase [Euryarchaeota archaeon]MBU4031214.1 pantetheine-phosphate adenylyltransferase [Candidatus Thermoplasmatota archaeon]MBU4071874.1 pantetheine-phosphate adenylyltransferase [Candidatus Thermoplasmatota archaeon]MBU4144007.1 pantetheine-phosphate adenylyltransferase [Candidatus Thermoplasmatota archaeon]MBU4591879.1 pantetheine-phosphate adenylyltransferase [Candidatus Thermoplasmatota archaeon]